MRLPGFRRLFALFGLRKVRKNKQQQGREKFTRGKTMRKRMIGNAKRIQRNSTKGATKNAKKSD
jgi:hypothetical protein